MLGSQENLGEIVVTSDGSLTLAHPQHGETYHSRVGADTEARLLYVEASGIRDRLKLATPLAVLDVGLGLAYNAFQTIEAWLEAPSPGDISLISLEVDCVLVKALASGCAPWQAGWSRARRELAMSLQALGSPADVEFATQLRHPSGTASLAWRIVIADASSRTVPCAPRPYDFVWQDPFSPEKNPLMWSQAWFEKLRSALAADATVMSYSVARAVRDALTHSGFSVERIATAQFAHAAPEGVDIQRYKRQWLRAKPAVLAYSSSTMSSP